MTVIKGWCVRAFLCLGQFCVWCQNFISFYPALRWSDQNDSCSNIISCLLQWPTTTTASSKNWEEANSKKWFSFRTVLFLPPDPSLWDIAALRWENTSSPDQRGLLDSCFNLLAKSNDHIYRMLKESNSKIWPNQTNVSDQSELTILLCQPMIIYVGY